MDAIEEGKERVEQLITRIAQGMKPASAVSSFVWWSNGSPEQNAEGAHDDAQLPLRIYRGNSWRSMEFRRSDVEGCAASPEMLTKYEGEIAQILAEL